MTAETERTGEATGAVGLPSLPEPAQITPLHSRYFVGFGYPVFTADQMQDYARSAIAASASAPSARMTGEQIDDIRRQVWKANPHVGVIDIYREFARAILASLPELAVHTQADGWTHFTGENVSLPAQTPALPEATAQAPALSENDVKRLRSAIDEYEALSKRWQEARPYSQEVANLSATFKARERDLGRLMEDGVFQRLLSAALATPEARTQTPARAEEREALAVKLRGVWNDYWSSAPVVERWLAVADAAIAYLASRQQEGLTDEAFLSAMRQRDMPNATLDSHVSGTVRQLADTARKASHLDSKRDIDVLE